MIVKKKSNLPGELIFLFGGILVLLIFILAIGLIYMCLLTGIGSLFTKEENMLICQIGSKSFVFIIKNIYIILIALSLIISLVLYIINNNNKNQLELENKSETENTKLPIPIILGIIILIVMFVLKNRV